METRANFYPTLNAKKDIVYDIPFEIIKKTSGEEVKCLYCLRIFSKQSEHKEHECDKLSSFLEDCVSCCELYIDHYASDYDSDDTVILDDTVNDNEDATLMKPRFQCCVCDERFPNLRMTVRHIQSHNKKKEQPFSCHQCQKSFADKYKLAHHQNSHTDERPFVCDKCDKTFKTASSRRQHLILHSEETPFVCSTCDKGFKSKRCLKTHREVHNVGKQYECSVCNKRFKTSNSLKSHLHQHKSTRNFKCTHCEQAFFRQSHLDAHIVIHTGVKNFICKECGKGFCRRDNLTVHERIHSGIKPYKCNLCDRSFNQQAGLKAHLVSHSEERPYTCLKCNRSFKYNSQIKHHACKPEMASILERPTMAKTTEINQEDVGEVEEGDMVDKEMPANEGVIAGVTVTSQRIGAIQENNVDNDGSRERERQENYNGPTSQVVRDNSLVQKTSNEDKQSMDNQDKMTTECSPLSTNTTEVPTTSNANPAASQGFTGVHPSTQHIPSGVYGTTMRQQPSYIDTQNGVPPCSGSFPNQYYANPSATNPAVAMSGLVGVIPGTQPFIGGLHATNRGPRITYMDNQSRKTPSVQNIPNMQQAAYLIMSANQGIPGAIMGPPQLMGGIQGTTVIPSDIRGSHQDPQQYMIPPNVNNRRL